MTQDNVTQPFEGDFLPYSLFAVRVPEARIPELREILLNYTDEQVRGGLHRPFSVTPGTMSPSRSDIPDYGLCRCAAVQHRDRYGPRVDRRAQPPGRW